jgi:hypothetical protein
MAYIRKRRRSSKEGRLEAVGLYHTIDTVSKKKI